MGIITRHRFKWQKETATQCTKADERHPRQARDGVTAGHRRWSFLFLCMKKINFRKEHFQMSIFSKLFRRKGPLLPLLDTAQTLTQGISASVKNGTSIRGVLKFTSLVNPAQVKAEKDKFVADYFNPENSGGIAATDQRFDFVPTNVTAYNVPQEQIEAVNRQIYDYLGVNAAIINGSYTEDEFSAFYESVIEPFAMQLSGEFALKCAADVIFTPERMEFSTADTKIKLLHEAAPLGVITINEARHLLALPPIDGGERRLQSLNYVSAEKADSYQLNESEGNSNEETDKKQ
jgi:hypothetical protein